MTRNRIIGRFIEATILIVVVLAIVGCVVHMCHLLDSIPPRARTDQHENR